MHIQRAVHAAIFSLAAVAIAACGGGGGGTSGGGGTIPTNTPTPVPSNSGNGSIVVGPQAVSTALPAIGGYSGTVQFPPANISATVTMNTSTTVPAGMTAPQERRAAASANIPLFYLGLTAQASVTLTGTPRLIVTVPSGTDMTQKFYVAAYLGSNGWVTFDGPASVSGDTLTFALQNGSVVLSGGVPLELVVYSGAPLQKTLAASPSVVQLLSTTDSQTVTVSDETLPPAFALANTFSITNSTCQGIVSVSAASASSFKIDAVATGMCSFSIADSFGSATPVSVSVTSTSVVTQ